MVKCPNCGAEAEKPSKTWRYGVFTVEAYTCEGCGLRFREYSRDEKHVFMLKLEKGKGFVKA
ncbi:MAG: hypothetical protein DRJ37_02705 [Thermoprotei archaeon]|nr:MAG: hypothetical protein DRJ37_02705 [Thermoprotei archaeon]